MYSEELLSPCVLPTSAPSTAGSLTGTGDILVYNFGEQVVVTRLMVLVSTAIVSTGSVVVTVYQRPTYGSTVGQVTVGTLTIPAGTAAGTIVYKDVESVKVPQGSQLAFNCSTAAAGGGAAGACFSMFKAFMASEDPRNIATMLKSA